MTVLEGYAKVIETIHEIDALYTATKALVLRHPEVLDDVTAAFTNVLKVVASKFSVVAALQVLASVRDAYSECVKAYTDETASGAIADLVAKLKAIAE